MGDYDSCMKRNPVNMNLCGLTSLPCEVQSLDQKNSLKSLRAWQKAMDLVNAVYQATKSFPKEISPLTSRLRKTVLSVPSHIAESSTDGSAKQLSQFLSKAIFSLNEVENQLERALSLGHIVKNDHRHLRNMVSECLALTNGLRDFTPGINSS